MADCPFTDSGSLYIHKRKMKIADTFVILKGKD